MVKGLFIPADPEQPLEVRNFNTQGDYQAAVGGWIEAVDVPTLGASLYVNEEGLIRHLPFNSRATSLWWYEIQQVRQYSRVVGDALIVGIPDSNGDSTDLPPSTMDQLTTKEPYGVLMRVDDSPVWARHPLPYEDYFEAVVWAMILSEEVTGAIDIKVVASNKVRDFSSESDSDVSAR